MRISPAAATALIDIERAWVCRVIDRLWRPELHNYLESSQLYERFEVYSERP